MDSRMEHIGKALEEMMALANESFEDKDLLVSIYKVSTDIVEIGKKIQKNTK